MGGNIPPVILCYGGINMTKKRNFEDGTICHINFGDIALNGEIYNYHLGIIFNIKGISNTVFCIPLTSPKPKHFESIKD